MRIILLGESEGKGTQAQKLSDKFAIPHIFQAITTDPNQRGRLAMNGVVCNARRQNRARSTTDSRVMITGPQIAARRNATCPCHHLGLGMA